MRIAPALWLLLVIPGPGEEVAASPLVTYALPHRERFEGVVIERLEAGPYRYLRVEAEGQAPQWIATLRSTNEAERVRVTVVARAARFESRRLGKSFSPLSFGLVEALTTRKEVP